MIWTAVIFFVMGSVVGAVLMSLCAASGRNRNLAEKTGDGQG